MNDARLLVIGREDGIVRGWVDHLRGAGTNISVVADGASALRHLGMLDPDAILVDLRLDGTVDGFDTCRGIRSHSDAPVVIAADGAGPYEEVVALAVGADHFVPKDVPVEVVTARLRALLRRARGGVLLDGADGVGGMAGAPAATNGVAGRRAMDGRVPRDGAGVPVGAMAGRGGALAARAGSGGGRGAGVAATGLRIPGAVGVPMGLRGADGTAERIVEGDLEIDLVAREVRVAGSITSLTRIEFDLLVTLARQPRRVFTREQLMSSAWEEPFDGSHVLDTHLSRLRGKITEAGGARVGHAVRGVGYRLRE